MFCRRLSAVASIVIAIMACANALGDDARSSTIDAVVDGIIARTTALVSGRIEYHIKTGLANAEKPMQDAAFALSLMGPSWARRSPGFPGVAIDHGGMHLSYYEADRNDGEKHRVANLLPSEAIDKHRPAPPYFAGTLWYRTCTEFIDRNRTKASVRPGGQFEGAPTHIIEWSIGASELSAFGVFNKPLAEGGVLRLHVAPSFGYALPRIEYLDGDGQAQITFDSSGFWEAADGLFLPRICEFQDRPNGKLSYYVRYDITNAELVNEAIPEEDFQMQLPLGTHVNDSRIPGATTVFQVSELPIDGEMGNLIRSAVKTKSAVSASPTVLGAAVGGGFIAVMLVLRALRRPTSAGAI